MVINESLLDFVTEDENIRIEKEWIKEMKESFRRTGNPIQRPILYAEARVERLNRRMAKYVTILEYIEWINSH